MNETPTKKPARVYRIHNAQDRVMYTGTYRGSWLTLAEAQETVRRENGETIYQYTPDYMNRMWEIC